MSDAAVLPVQRMITTVGALGYYVCNMSTRMSLQYELCLAVRQAAFHVKQSIGDSYKQLGIKNE